MKFSSIVEFEDADALKHSNRVNPNVRIELLPRDHIAFRPGGKARGVFAAKDIPIAKVIGIQVC